MAKKKQTVQEQSPVQKHIARIDKLYGVVMKQSVHDAVAMTQNSKGDILNMIKGEIIIDGHWKPTYKVPYALHALLFILRQKHPYAFVEEIRDLKYLKEALNVAKKLSKPNIERHTENTENISNPVLLQSLAITSFVADNWDLAYSQLEQWSRAIEENENKIVTTKSIKWEKLLEKYPINEYRRGELLSQEDLAALFGITVPYLAHKKSTIVKRIKGTKAEKEFKEWFVVGETRGNPSKLRAEYFPAYAFLIESISLPTDKKEKRRATIAAHNGKAEVVDVKPAARDNKIEVIESAENIENIDEKPAAKVEDVKKSDKKHLGLVGIKGVQTVLSYLIPQKESDLKNVIEAQKNYKAKKQEVDAVSDPLVLAELLPEQTAANLVVVDTTKAFNATTAEIKEGEALIAQDAELDQELRQILEKRKQHRAKMMAFVEKHKAIIK